MNENKAPMTEKERKKAQRRDTRGQAWFALRVVLSAYLVYLGYDLIRTTVTAEEDMGIPPIVSILIGVAFGVFGIYVLLQCWKTKKQMDREERERQRAEAEAKGLLNFDEDKDDESLPVAAAADEDEAEKGWGYRPENTAETAYIYEPEEKEE